MAQATKTNIQAVVPRKQRTASPLTKWTVLKLTHPRARLINQLQLSPLQRTDVLVNTLILAPKVMSVRKIPMQDIVVREVQSPRRIDAEMRSLAFSSLLSSRVLKAAAMRSIAVLVIMSLSVGSLRAAGTTAAYYNDTETSKDNSYVAGSVDFTLAQTPYSLPQTASNLAQGEVASTTVKVTPEASSNTFWYQASSTNFGIDLDFCQTLSVTSILEGVQNFSGLLSNFLSPATTTLDDWQIDVSTNVNSYNKICAFDFNYDAWQERHNLPAFDEMGFSDVETVHNKIASKGFRINKVYYDVEEGGDAPQISCAARSKGYWAENEGCSGGSGSADWNDEVNALSATYSSIFGTMSGSGMCSALYTPNCPSGNTVEANLCKAKTHTLADEMNVASGKLDPAAIISDADDGDSAFDNLGLGTLSTVSQALVAVEAVLGNASSTVNQLKDAAYVAKRVYTFYESENPNAPYCAYLGGSDANPSRGVEGENEWVEVYNQTDASVDFSGWKICDDASCDMIPSGTPPIPPLGFALITNNPNTASSTALSPWFLPDGVIYIPLGQLIGDGLDNDADMLTLRRPDEIIVDQMNWGTPDSSWSNYNADVWNPGATDVAEGNVLARVPTGFDTDEPSDWKELVPPSVDLIYPNEGASYVWYWGDSYNIKWTATNHNGPDSALKIALYYIKDNDDSNSISVGDTTHTITASTTNDGSYIWTVPSGFMGYIWIKLVAFGPENPFLNTMTASGSIFDPIPLFVGPHGIDLEDLDLEAPVITLIGNNPAVVPFGAEYSDLGALVTDNVSKNLGYRTEGMVDTSTLGKYTITYTAIDQAGNVGRATRLVGVYDPALGEPDLSLFSAASSEPIDDAVAVSTPETIETEATTEGDGAADTAASETLGGGDALPAATGETTGKTEDTALDTGGVSSTEAKLNSEDSIRDDGEASSTPEAMPDMKMASSTEEIVETGEVATTDAHDGEATSTPSLIDADAEAPLTAREEEVSTSAEEKTLAPAEKETPAPTVVSGEVTEEKKLEDDSSASVEEAVPTE